MRRSTGNAKLNSRKTLARQDVVAMAKHARLGRPMSKRVRGTERMHRLPFVPPEDWHEPIGDGAPFRIVKQPPGAGYRHIVTAREIRQRLSLLPEHMVAPLEVVQLSRLTRKKLSFPCYGMQWGSAVYLYPLEEDLVEVYGSAPKPNQFNEARMYGGQWIQEGNCWRLVWTQRAIKDFYLNNILIHELGHVLDDRNSSYADRERYAEWFALEYGYKPSRRRRANSGKRRPIQRRHHSRRKARCE